MQAVFFVHKTPKIVIRRNESQQNYYITRLSAMLTVLHVKPF
jgi:hypothetical protein